jgi:hypothetical protein
MAGERGARLLAEMHAFSRRMNLCNPLNELHVMLDNVKNGRGCIKLEYEEDPAAPIGYKHAEAILDKFNGTTISFEHVDIYIKEMPPFPDNKYYRIRLPEFLERINNIPKGLLCLSMEYTHLTELPELPESLQTLKCASGELSVCPTLPPSIVEFEIPMNKITRLPDLTPFGHLRVLNCSGNELTELPALPASLRKLDCSENQLTELPALPASLRDLNCYQNQLTELPALPASLRKLECSINMLTHLPDLKHCDSLWYISCFENALRHLPDLPDALVTFCYSENPIENPPSQDYKYAKNHVVYPNSADEDEHKYDYQIDDYTLFHKRHPEYVEHLRKVSEELGYKPSPSVESLQK